MQYFNSSHSEFRETKKFNTWVKYFIDKSNAKTFLNATQSALAAYGYESKSQYHLASVTGSKNMRKYEYLGSTAMDALGVTFQELMKIGIDKMKQGKYQDWEHFMKLAGYFPNEYQIKQNIQVQQQYDFSNLATDLVGSRRTRGLENT
jgi:hypothetical protein